MKYFYGEIEERNGGMEYNHPVFYRAKSFAGASVQHLRMLKNFYGSGYLNEDNWYEFDECWCCDGGWNQNRLPVG